MASRIVENERADVLLDTSGIEVLMSLRRIIRAIDIYSRRLNTEFNITAPQLICLYSLGREEGLTLSTLARRVNLGISTVNGIIDRLEQKGLVRRKRSDIDRRRVILSITERGTDLARSAPALLQEKLVAALRRLPEAEQDAISSSLETIADLLEGASLESCSSNVDGEEEDERLATRRI